MVKHLITDCEDLILLTFFTNNMKDQIENVDIDDILFFIREINLYWNYKHRHDQYRKK